MFRAVEVSPTSADHRYLLVGLGLGSVWLTVGLKMVDFPGVFTCRGGSPNDLEGGFLNPFTGGADAGGSLLLSEIQDKRKSMTRN